MQLRRVLEDYAAGEFVLEDGAALLELADGGALFLLGAEHADVDVAVLEVRRQVHAVDGHQLGGKREVARDDRAEFA